MSLRQKRPQQPEQQGFTGFRRRLRQRVVREWKNIWKLFLALVAISDFVSCWPVFLEGWKSVGLFSSPKQHLKQFKTSIRVSAVDHHHIDLFTHPLDYNHMPFFHGFVASLRRRRQPVDSDGEDIKSNSSADTCDAYTLYYNCIGKARFVLQWMGPFFVVLCIVEATIRARQAREEMLEMAALDNFEKKLSQLYSTTRRFTNNTTFEEDDLAARRALRFWTPVLTTLFAWALLLPWTTFFDTRCGQETDTALATLWITQSLKQADHFSKLATEHLTRWVWQVLLPFRWWEPHKLYQRLLMLLRWVRYFRFAGPLLRLLLKLQDQFWVLLYTHRRWWQVQAERTKRELRRSMLFQDLARIESQIAAGLKRVPTKQLLEIAQDQVTKVVGNLALAKKQQEKKIKRQIDYIKEQVRRGGAIIPTSELYDRIMDLGKELTTTVSSTLWTANLIPPQTRFSLIWRAIVTLALMAEISRVCTAFQLYGTVDVSYTSMMMSVLGCERGSNVAGNILTATGRFTRKVVRHLLRMPKEQLPTVCSKSSITPHRLANLLLNMSGAFEATIDIVCFIDIYVWFFTGELAMNGQVIPKPFFYRCILPGTLSQVLDHPTLPEVLPNLLSCFWNGARAVGYSRTIRWALAIGPALNILIAEPLNKFWLKPMKDEEWLQFTESMAIMPSFLSGADIRYAVDMSHPSMSNLREAAIFSLQHYRRSGSDTHYGLRRARTDDRRDPHSLISFDKSAAGSSTHVKFAPIMPARENLTRRESSTMGLSIDASSSSDFNYIPSVPSYSSFKYALRESSSTGLNIDNDASYSSMDHDFLFQNPAAANLAGRSAAPVQTFLLQNQSLRNIPAGREMLPLMTSTSTEESEESEAQQSHQGTLQPGLTTTSTIPELKEEEEVCQTPHALPNREESSSSTGTDPTISETTATSNSTILESESEEVSTTHLNDIPGIEKFSVRHEQAQFRQSIRSLKRCSTIESIDHEDDEEEDSSTPPVKSPETLNPLASPVPDRSSSY